MTAVVDHDGRLFGRWNVIDVAVVLLLLLMIPVAYGAYLLFRAPIPVITTLSPTQLVFKRDTLVNVTGENLRVYLKVRVGPDEGALLVESPNKAALRLPPNVGPGTYDLVLFDESRELFRMNGAITIVPPPPPPAPAPPPPAPEAPIAEMQAVGAFVAVSPAQAKVIRRGVTLDVPGAPPAKVRLLEVAAVRPAEPGTQVVRVGDNAEIRTRVAGSYNVPAILTVRCRLNGPDCKLGSVTVQRTALLSATLPGGGPDNEVNFRVAELRAAGTPLAFSSSAPARATVRVQLFVLPEIANLVKAGDVDRHDVATLRSLGERSRVNGTSNVGGGTQVPLTVLAIEGTFDVEATFDNDVWRYGATPLRAGENFNFETLRYAIGGPILDVRIADGQTATTR